MRALFYSISLPIVLTGLCFAAPEPAIVPGPGIWTVNAMFTHPQQIIVRPNDNSRPKRFWYVILTLTNNTGLDVDFYPQCELMTDTFQIIPAGQAVPTAIFDRIKSRHQSKYPFLESLETASDKILQGEDNTKDIVVIWHDFDLRARSIKVFISGLSNETVTINHPVARDPGTGKPVRVYLRKTLELNYDLKTDPALQSEAGLAYKDKRWIMR